MAPIQPVRQKETHERFLRPAVFSPSVSRSCQVRQLPLVSTSGDAALSAHLWRASSDLSSSGYTAVITLVPRTLTTPRVFEVLCSLPQQGGHRRPVCLGWSFFSFLYITVFSFFRFQMNGCTRENICWALVYVKSHQILFQLHARL